MITRNLHTLTRNLFLGTSLLTAVLFTSCSRSLTSLRNSDTMQNQQVLSNPSRSNTASSPTTQMAVTTPKKEIVPVIAQPTNPEVAVPTQKHQFRKWAGYQSKLVIDKTKLVKNLITSNVDKTVASIQGHDKSNVLMSAQHSAHPTRDLIRTGIMCLVISLVLYLLAWLLFFADPLSWLFYVLATIFFIAGVLFLLFGLLRMM